MAKRDENSLSPTPLPQRGQKSGNLDKRTKRTQDKRTPAIPAQKYQQISLRVPPSTRTEFDDAFEASGADTKVKFMAMLLQSWQERAGTSEAPQASASDIAGGRTKELHTWVRPDVASILTRSSRKHGISVGGVLDPIIGHYLQYQRQQSAAKKAKS